MFRKISWLCTAGAALLFSSCGDKSPFPGFEKGESGIYFKFYKKNETGQKPKFGEYVTVKLVRKTTGDSVIFDSRKQNPQEGTVEYRLDKPPYPSSLESGISMMSIGDSASFYVFTDSLKKFMPPDQGKMLKPGVTILFDIKLVKIRSAQEVDAENQKKFEEFMAKSKMKEPEMISEYITTNKVTAKPDVNGMYFIETEKGKGPKAKTGSKVSVKYTGKFLDGNIFDASDYHGGKPYEFTIGNKEVILGWDLGIMMMSKGGKATLLLPSKLGYDSIGMQDPQTGRFAIYPYTPLVFDVELLDIK